MFFDLPLTWLGMRKTLSVPTPAKRRRRRPTYRPTLERLEDRLAPASHTWRGGTGIDGDRWSVGANWVSNNPPQVGESDIELIFPFFNADIRNTVNDVGALTVSSIRMEGVDWSFASSTAANSITLGAGGITVQNSLPGDTYTWSIPLVISLNNTPISVEEDPTLVVNAAISGTGALEKTGLGTLALTAASPDFNGLLRVTEGTLLLAKPAGVNALPGSLIIGDNTRPPGSAVVRLLVSNQLPNDAPVTINRSGRMELNNFSETIGPLDMTGGSISTGTGTLTLTSGVRGSSDSAGNAAAISGRLSLGTATRTFDVSNGPGATNLLISAVISSGGLTKQGTGTLSLTGQQYLRE